MTSVTVPTGQLQGIILNKVGTHLHPEAAVCFTLVPMQCQYRWSSNVQTSILSDRLGNAKPWANCSAKLDYQTIQNGAKVTIKWHVHVTFASLPFCVIYGSRLFCTRTTWQFGQLTAVKQYVLYLLCICVRILVLLSTATVYPWDHINRRP
jgi:hypothetical protein